MAKRHFLLFSSTCLPSVLGLFLICLFSFLRNTLPLMSFCLQEFILIKAADLYGDCKEGKFIFVGHLCIDDLIDGELNNSGEHFTSTSHLVLCL